MEAPPTSRAPLGRRARARLRGARRRAASSTRRCRRSRFALRDRSAGRRRDPLGLLDVAAPDRGAPPRATTTASRSGCSSCSASRARWGDDAADAAVDAHHAGRAAVRRARRVVELHVPCTYDFEVTRRAATSTRSTTARCRSSSCSAARSSTPAPGGLLQTARISWEQRGRLPAAGRASGARRWTATSPARAWLRLRHATRFDRLAAYKARHALPTWERRVDALLRRGERGARGPACARSPTPCSTRATCCGRTAARRSKNQRRWTFGGVLPARPQRARIRTTRWRDADAECLVEGGGDARVEVRVRFLHVVARGVGGRADGEPVDELTRGGERHLAWDEAVEREVALGRRSARSRAATVPIAIPAGREEELREPRARAARSCARWEPLAGTVEVARRAASADGVARVTVRDRQHDARGPAATARRRCGARSARRTPSCARAAARSSR